MSDPGQRPLIEELLESLRQPVYVEDPDNLQEVVSALHDAWDTRITAYSVGTEVLSTGGDGNVMVVTIGVDYRVADDDEGRLTRSGVARLNPQDDPWDAWQLAFRRASSLWHLVPRVRTAGDQHLQQFIDRELGGLEFPPL